MGILDNFFDELKRERIEENQRKANELGISLTEYETQLAKEQERRDLEFAKQEAKRQQEITAKIELEKTFRINFGRQLGLPVPAHIGHVLMLSGLSERSMGNGTTRATVYHVIVNDELTLGRLKREKYDLLCRSSNSLAIGKGKTFDVSGIAPDEIYQDWWHNQPITCRACLTILNRISKKKSLCR